MLVALCPTDLPGKRYHEAEPRADLYPVARQGPKVS
jgi:hypothetical protein